MYNSQNVTTIDFSTARGNLSQIINNVYLNREAVVITKRNIPLVRIIKEEESFPIANKTLKSPLFGIWKNDKRSAVTIANELKRKSWKNLKKYAY
jgi:antitoxin (DNA-binding transcriptional repressor) of toxin-antitoxin stability system